jgi:DnaJ domain
MTPADPFVALGLRRSGDLSDDEVRSAWRRVAASTHPDRADGGDPEAFAAAAAAYAALRSSAGRRDALADLAGSPQASDRRRPLISASVTGRWPGARLAHRVLRGRPLMLALRVLTCAAVSAMVVAIAGWQPAAPAIITGAVTWLLLTGQADLGERPGRQP